MRTRYQSEWVKKKTGEEKKEKKTYLNKLATRSTSSATHIFHSYLINKTKREEEEEDGEGERKKLSAPYDGAVLECSAYCCLHSKHSDRTVNMEFSFFFFYTLSFHTASSSSFFRDAMYGTKKMVKTKQKKKISHLLRVKKRSWRERWWFVVVVIRWITCLPLGWLLSIQSI